MAGCLTAVLMFAMVMSSAALVSKEVLHTRELLRERIQISKTADEAEQRCQNGDTVGAMKVIALSYRPGGMKMTQEEGRRLLNACFAQQDVLGEGIFCKLGSQDQCDWASACVEEGKCDSPPLGEALAQLKASTDSKASLKQLEGVESTVDTGYYDYMVGMSGGNGTTYSGGNGTVGSGSDYYYQGKHDDSDKPDTVPDGFSCQWQWYDAQDGCDCLCGVRDPDCDRVNTQIYGCEEWQGCDLDATCRNGLLDMRRLYYYGDYYYDMDYYYLSGGSKGSAPKEGTCAEDTRYVFQNKAEVTYGMRFLFSESVTWGESDEICLRCDGGSLSGSIHLKLHMALTRENEARAMLRFTLFGNTPETLTFYHTLLPNVIHKLAIGYSKLTKEVVMILYSANDTGDEWLHECDDDDDVSVEGVECTDPPSGWSMTKLKKTFTGTLDANIRRGCVGGWQQAGTTGNITKSLNPPQSEESGHYILDHFSIEEGVLCATSVECRYAVAGLNCGANFNPEVPGICTGVGDSDEVVDLDECQTEADCNGQECIDVQSENGEYWWKQCAECEVDHDCWGHAHRTVCDDRLKLCVWPEGWTPEGVGDTITDKYGEESIVGNVAADWMALGADYGFCPEGLTLSRTTGQCEAETEQVLSAFHPRDSLGNLVIKHEKSGTMSGKATIKGKGPKVHQWEGKFPRVHPDHVSNGKGRLGMGRDDLKNSLEGMGPGSWTSNPLANFAITASQIAVKGGAERHFQKEDWLWDKVVPWILAK